IGGAKSDVVLLVAILYGELAGHSQQIGVGQEIGRVVVVVADARKHAYAPFVSFRIVPRVLERLVREFEKDTLLRIHDSGFERIDAKEGGIKKIRSLNQPPSADVVRIVAKMFVDAGAQFLRGKKRYRFDGIAEVTPQLIKIGSAREAAGHADHSDGIARAVVPGF